MDRETSATMDLIAGTLGSLCEGLSGHPGETMTLQWTSHDCSSLRKPNAFDLPSDFSLEAASCARWSWKAGYPSMKW